MVVRAVNSFVYHSLVTMVLHVPLVSMDSIVLVGLVIMERCANAVIVTLHRAKMVPPAFQMLPATLAAVQLTILVLIVPLITACRCHVKMVLRVFPVLPVIVVHVLTIIMV